VHVGAALVADEQAFETAQPSEGALDQPTQATEPGAVRGSAAGDQGRDPAPPKLDQVVLVVVGAVGDHAGGSSAGPADDAADGRNGIEQRDQLQDVVAVAAAQAPGERKTAAVDEKVVLGAETPPYPPGSGQFRSPRT
jgi:hypothetical protein